LGAEENYFIEAGKYYDVNPALLYAIGKKESNLNPKAVNCANENKSCDYGIMQINSIHLPMLSKYNIFKEDLLSNPRVNIFFGAWYLKGCINKHGENYKALNCYNGRIKKNSYYMDVIKHYHKSLRQQETITEEPTQEITQNVEIISEAIDI
jgi:soluble lytic murein transglycosylase-like protein